jgi:membrane-associated phospholipid phosphatase
VCLYIEETQLVAVMDRINQQGLKGILAIQRLPPLGGLIRLAGLLGDDVFLMMIVAACYWGGNVALGTDLAVVLGLATAVNHLLKLAFRGPRPYWMDFRVRALSKSHDYGLPSRHVQNAVLTLGVLLKYLPSTWWGWALAGGLVLVGLVGLSRMYVGVHLPGDVAAGFGLGVTGWLIYSLISTQLRTGWGGLGLWSQVGLAFVASIAYLGLVGIVLKVIATRPDPKDWTQVAGGTIKPRDATYQFATAGSLFGLGTALAFALAPNDWLRLDAGVDGWILVARMLIGVVGLIVFWYGGELLPFKKGSLSSYLFNYVQHALLLLWLFFLAPFVFAVLHL